MDGTNSIIQFGLHDVCSTTERITEQRNAKWCNVTRTTKSSTVQFSTAQHSTAQHSTAQYSPHCILLYCDAFCMHFGSSVSYCTIRCYFITNGVQLLLWCGVVCAVVCGVVWCGVVWCGVVWRGVAWCGVVCCCAAFPMNVPRCCLMYSALLYFVALH